jgi:putative DNA methylase
VVRFGAHGGQQGRTRENPLSSILNGRHAWLEGARLTQQSKREKKMSSYRKSRLTPVAYLWTRTVTCKNPNCRAIVPLVKQTWLCKKNARYVALNIFAPKDKKHVRFEVVEACADSALGVDPAVGSSGGNVTCPFCGTVADADYVQVEGCAGRVRQTLTAAVCTRKGLLGKVSISADQLPDLPMDEAQLVQRVEWPGPARGC